MATTSKPTVLACADITAVLVVRREQRTITDLEEHQCV
jgi:hypothetical protein